MIKRIFIKFFIEAIVDAFIEVMQERSAKSSSTTLKKLVQTLVDEREILKEELIAKVK